MLLDTCAYLNELEFICSLQTTFYINLLTLYKSTQIRNKCQLFVVSPAFYSGPVSKNYNQFQIH